MASQLTRKPRPGALGERARSRLAALAVLVSAVAFSLASCNTSTGSPGGGPCTQSWQCAGGDISCLYNDGGEGGGPGFCSTICCCDGLAPCTVPPGVCTTFIDPVCVGYICVERGTASPPATPGRVCPQEIEF
jgi:hypothetical protein